MKNKSMSDILNIGKAVGLAFSKNPDTAAAYKAGFEECAKEMEKLRMERDTAVAQVGKLGYELGESYSPIRAAAKLKKDCICEVSCRNGCAFWTGDRCALASRPSEWPVSD